METSSNDESRWRSSQSGVEVIQTLPGSLTRHSNPQPKRRLWRGIGFALLIVLLLVLIGGGGAGYFAYQQYPALNAFSNRFCRDLSQQNYGDAYQLLSQRLQTQLPGITFIKMANDLDTIEGSVESCSAQSQNVPQLGVFPLSLTVLAAITRAGSYHGTIRAVYESGAWKIDGMSASLLGASLSTLGLAEQYCQDYAATDYLAMWSLYGRQLQNNDPGSRVKAATAALPPLSQRSTLGTCSVAALGAQNSDLAARMTFLINDADQVSVDLRLENGSWKITSIGSDPVAMLIRTNAPPSAQELDRQFAIISNEVAQIQQGSTAPDWQEFTHNPVYVFTDSPSRGPEQTPGGVLDLGNGGGRVIATGFVGAFTNASNLLYVVLLVQAPRSRTSDPSAFLSNPRFLILRWQSNSDSGVASHSLGHTVFDLVGHAGVTSGGAIEMLNPLANSPDDGNAVQVTHATNDYLIGQWVGIYVGLQKNDPTNHSLADYLSGANAAPPERLLTAQEVLPVVQGIMHSDTVATATVKLSVYYLNFIATNFKSRS